MFPEGVWSLGSCTERSVFTVCVVPCTVPGAGLPWGAEMPFASHPVARRGRTGRGRSNQAAQLPGSAPAFTGNQLPALQKGALLLQLGEDQKPLLLPPSPGLGRAVVCEQKGAFVCLLCGDRALRGQGSAGTGLCSPGCNSCCCGADLACPSPGGVWVHPS